MTFNVIQEGRKKWQFNFFWMNLPFWDIGLFKSRELNASLLKRKYTYIVEVKTVLSLGFGLPQDFCKIKDSVYPKQLTYVNEKSWMLKSVSIS
jgi:hypothetical protein